MRPSLERRATEAVRASDQGRHQPWGAGSDPDRPSVIARQSHVGEHHLSACRGPDASRHLRHDLSQLHDRFAGTKIPGGPDQRGTGPSGSWDDCCQPVLSGGGGPGRLGAGGVVLTPHEPNWAALVRPLPCQCGSVCVARVGACRLVPAYLGVRANPCRAVFGRIADVLRARSVKMCCRSNAWRPRCGPPRMSLRGGR